MPNATIERPARTPLADLSTNLEPLFRSYDPPVRGPLLLASAGRGTTNATFFVASALAERFQVGVEVAGVLEPYPVLLFAERPPMLPPDFETIQCDIIRRSIERRIDAIGPDAKSWPITIFYGDPARTIATVAREHDSTMIVVGLGRHDRLRRLSGGERALRILRGADRPMLAVAPDVVALPTRAVVGMDFSAASIRAARAALMTLTDDGVLILVHVRPVIDLLPLYATQEHSRESYETLLARWQARSDREAAMHFAHVVEELRQYAPKGVRIETQTRPGVVVEELLEIADVNDAQLIAVGTHGPGVIERFFIGSVATEVLRRAGRSVLVAPAPDAAESARLSLRVQGTANVVEPGEWAVVLEKFSARNDGRRVKLEVDDPGLGAQLQQSGLSLLGVTYDRHDKRVDVMLGDPQDRVRHLTRSIPRADDVSIVAEPGGPERTLRILSGRSQTLVTFLD